MRLPLLTLAVTLALPLAVASQTHAETLSEEIARAGLAPTLARLTALPAPTPEDRFAIGGLHFLRAVEQSFQTRYTYGLTDRTGMLPFLRLTLQDNPAPKDFAPEVIATLFRDAAGELAQAQAALAETGDFGLTLNLGDLWFDVNADGARQPDEGFLPLAGNLLMRLPDTAPDTAAPSIRFDTADAAWLSAYAKLLGGVAEVVLAYDPTEPITRILSARTAMAEWGPAPPDWIMGGSQIPDSTDMIAMVLATANQTPDKQRMAKALALFQSAIADNHRFWALVGVETDDELEWLPNARQTSPFGLTLPPETATVWGAVLDDADALLAGRKLAPYWRVSGPAGLNINKVFTDPRPADLAGWVQGWAALPYLEPGNVVTADTWRAFENMAGGDPMLMALWLN